MNCKIFAIVFVLITNMAADKERSDFLWSYMSFDPFEAFPIGRVVSDLSIVKNFIERTDKIAGSGGVTVFFRASRNPSAIMRLMTLKDGKAAIFTAVLDKSKMDFFGDELKNDDKAKMIRNNYDVYSGEIAHLRAESIQIKRYIVAAEWISTHKISIEKYGQMGSAEICIYVISDKGVSALYQVDENNLLGSFSQCFSEIMNAATGGNLKKDEIVSFSDKSFKSLEKYMRPENLGNSIKSPGIYLKNAEFGDSIGETEASFAMKCGLQVK